MAVYSGTGKASITPPVGTLLSGYNVIRPSKGVKDHIQARVIAIKSDQNHFIIISLDLLCIDKQYSGTLKSHVSSRFHIPQKNILVHATHTHSGPGGIFHESSFLWKAFPRVNGWTYDESLVEDQHEKIIKAIEDALSSLELCEVRYGETEVYGIAANRNSPDQEYVPKLKVVEFINVSGDRSILYHFGCHPTIMHADNQLISADFPGAASRNLEERDDIKLALFLNGPCGDISTRYTRRESSFKEVDRMGKLLSDGILSVLNETFPLVMTDFQSSSVSMEISLRKTADPEQLRKKLTLLQEKYEKEKSLGKSPAELRRLKSKIEGSTASIEIGRKLQNISSITTYVQFIKLGELIFVAVPGELFSETGNEIMQQYSNVPLIITGNTNDQIGYIVPEHYYKDDSYESSMTLMEKGTSENIRDQVTQNIGGMLNARKK